MASKPTYYQGFGPCPVCEGTDLELDHVLDGPYDTGKMRWYCACGESFEIWPK